MRAAKTRKEDLIGQSIKDRTKEPGRGWSLLGLQRSVGNRAVVGAVLQRDWTKSTGTGPGTGNLLIGTGRGSTTAPKTSPPTTTPPTTDTTPPTTDTTPPTTDITPPPTTDPTPPTVVAPVKTDLQIKFAKALGGKKVTLSTLRAVYGKSDMTARKSIADDRSLTDSARGKLGAGDFLQLMAELGVARTDGTVAHTSAKTADEKIREQFKDVVAKQIKDGKSAVGKVVVLDGEDWLTAYYHEFPDELPRGGPTDDEADTNAFTTTSKPKDVIVLNKDKGNAGTSVHEGIHVYQHDGSMKLGSNFYEGITEFFTRQITVPMGILRDNYDDEHDGAVKVAAAVTTEVLRKAYFKGDISALSKAFIQFRVGKGDTKKAAPAKWKELVQAFVDEDWAKIGTLCA